MPRREQLTTPYILFTELDTRERLDAWIGYRSALLRGLIERAEPGPDGTEVWVQRLPPDWALSDRAEPGRLIWRLFTVWHREVGGSALLFRNVAEARADALATTQGPIDGRIVPVVDPLSRRHSWYLGADGPDMISHHAYGDQRKRDAAIARLPELLRAAAVARTLDEPLPGHLDAHRLPMLGLPSERRGGGDGEARIVDRLHRSDFARRIRPSRFDRTRGEAG